MDFSQIEDDASLMWNVSVDAKLIDDLAAAISDYNPIHMSHGKAVEAGFKARLLHGAGLIGLVSSAVANKLPGPGSVILKIDASYLKPAYLGDELVCTLSVTKKYKLNNTIRFSYLILNKDSEKLALGNVTVMVPDPKA
tara:strand:- start:482 stop:898 length:417 start_codon:yes stop_codon:yes gene_type:complete